MNFCELLALGCAVVVFAVVLGGFGWVAREARKEERP